jgi:flagellar basal-body rod protein FlgB
VPDAYFLETAMFDKLFGGDTFIASTRALDAYALRHQTISNNLANINTPGYKRQEVSFEDQLAGALQAGSNPAGGAAHTVSQVTPSVTTIRNTSARADGNNVDLESENIDLAVNTLRFEALSQQVGGYFTGLKAVINSK